MIKDLTCQFHDILISITVMTQEMLYLCHKEELCAEIQQADGR